ncbi:MAG: hypothetical protein R3B57_09820 [Phycisphaerales bacterium]
MLGKARFAVQASAARRLTGIAITLAVVSCPALADAYGTSDGNNVSINLFALSGAQVTWNTNPALWYVNAQGYVDHSDTPGAMFAQDSELFTGVGDGIASLGLVSEPTVASARDLLSRVESGNPFMSIGEVHSLAHRIPASVAFSDGLVEVQNLFTLTPDDPDNPPSFVDVSVGVTGILHLIGDSLADEDWSAEYSLHIEIRDANDFDAPALYEFDDHHSIAGPGFDEYTRDLAESDQLSLEVGRTYFLYAFLDAETTAYAPAPATLGLLAAGLLSAARRRR